jgi:predicted metal-dependent enzyme (double-stranded beta helix superfamily)
MSNRFGRSLGTACKELGGNSMAKPEKLPFSRQRRSVIAGVAAVSSQLIMPIASRASSKLPTSVGRETMDIDRFVEDCLIANQESNAQAAVTEVLARAVSTPNAVISALGEPAMAGLNVLLSSPTLTIFAATWTPQMNLMPHNHLMWASIGIYTGREDNIFWKSTPDGIKAYGADALFVKDTAMLPEDAVHSVTNPLQRFTGGIHIYGGDFFDTTRSQWNPETLEQEPSDGAKIREMFQRENERLGLINNV